MGQISFLLGAGFSVPIGYPTAKMLNEKITGLKEADFCIATEGSVCWLKEGQPDPFNYSSYFVHKLFLLELIKFYISTYGDFNYEEFYDYFNKLSNSKNQDPKFEKFADDFRSKTHTDIDNTNLIMNHKSIFNQIISAFLVDNQGRKFYDPIHCCKPLYPGYTGFLYCLETFGEKGIVHIHTLNHDLFFEQFNSSDWLGGKLSDGFVELGSPYYGNLDGRFKVRLPYFADKYDTTFRLYKLHGSVDQYPFHIMNKGIESYIKIKPGVGKTELYKEVKNAKGELTYDNDWVNYHSDFLSGTTSKILRYREPWYYEKVFAHFEKNLEQSEKLIIIGYGCGDIEINDLIKKHYLNEKKSIYVVDPYPGKRTEEFCKNFKAKFIKKFIEDLTMDDFK